MDALRRLPTVSAIQDQERTRFLDLNDYEILGTASEVVERKGWGDSGQ